MGEKTFNYFHFILVFLKVIGVAKGPCGGITLTWSIRELKTNAIKSWWIVIIVI
jgi:hypothetical protein